MMIESNYEINVAKMMKTGHGYNMNRYEHFCRIELGWQLPIRAKELYTEIKEKFPVPEYTLQLSYIECNGSVIEED